jgi:hypothetical protein
MALKINGEIYHGHQCIHMLALLTTKNGFFNHITSWIFKSPRRAKVLYPLLRAGRSFLLFLLQRKKINADR